jgi:CRP-like cAMP-binding protein
MTDGVTIDSKVLSSINYFAGLSSNDLDDIRRYLSPRTLEKGELFMLEGDHTDSLYFVISGVVKIYKISAEGKEQIMNIATTGESLNDVSTFDESPTSSNMIAMNPVLLYGIKKSDLSSILLKYPQAALNALNVLAGRVRRNALLVETLSFNQVTGRLGKILLKYYGENKIPDIRLTQQDLANMIGTSREMVNKSLKIMETNGVIMLKRDGIEIIDQKALEDMTVIRVTSPLPGEV